MSVEKGWNEICGRENGRNPEKNLPRHRFVHHETHMGRPKLEFGTSVVGGERLNAYATEPPLNTVLAVILNNKSLSLNASIYLSYWHLSNNTP